MKKFYSDPEIEIRKYRLTDTVFTESDPGLHDGDEYDLDSVGPGEDLNSVFMD